MNSLPKKLAHRLFVMGCCCGLIAHVSVITSEYFKYQATSDVSMETPAIIPIPAISVCWRYFDILDINRLNRDLKLSLLPPNYTTLISRDVSLSAIRAQITVKQILDYTPTTDQLFTDSSVRYEHRYDVQHLDKTSTYENFRVLKYYTQDYICYRVGLKKNGQYDYNRVKKTLEYSSMAFEIGFNLTMFDPANSMLPIVQLGPDLPHYSRLFAPKVWRYRKDNGRNRICLTSQRVNVRKLPAPYPTGCVDYGTLDLPDLITRCLVKSTVEKFGKLPFTDIIPEDFEADLNYLVIEPNVTEYQRLVEIEHQCEAGLRKPECYAYWYMTSLVDMSPGDESIRFRVNLPNRPEITIIFQPMAHFFDFLTYVLSCFGTWIGLSIIDLSPITLVSGHTQKDGHKLSGLLSLVNGKQRWFKKPNYLLQSRLSRIETDIVTLKGQLVHHR